MKLLFEISRTQLELCRLSGNESVRVACPCDINIDGNIAACLFIATDRQIILLDGNTVALRQPLKSIKRFRYEVYVGAGALIAETECEDLVAARFSMKHVDRFTALTKDLNKNISDTEDESEQKESKECRCHKCGAPIVSGRCASCDKKNKYFLSLHRFLTICKPYISRLIATSLLMVIASACTLYTQQIIKTILDNYLRLPTGTFIQIIPLFVTAIILTSVNIVCTMSKKMLSARLGAKMSADLQTMVFDKIQSLSVSYITRTNAGEIMNRATSDASNVREFMDYCFGNMMSNLITMIGAVVFMALINWKLTLLAVGAVPFLLLISLLLNRKIRTIYRAQWRSDDKIKTRLHDVISGIRVVKVFGREQAEGKRFSELSNDLAKLSSRNDVFWAIFFPLVTFCMGLGLNFIYYFGGLDVINGTATPGSLVQFAAYGTMLYAPLRWMADMPRFTLNMLNSLDRIYAVLDEKPDITNAPGAVIKNIDGNVEFDSVCFGYNSYEPVLNNVSFSVKKGEMIGIVGESGSGKSTMINLLMRLYDVDSGRILIDGEDIRNLDTECLHSQIGVVLQETFLFAGTVLDNIRYSKPKASYEEIIRAAKMANAHDFICEMPDGYNTYIGERGHNVSGGQRQRIAIARAILANPRLLILDEATSSLDTESEELIQQAVARLTDGRTTFAIAHRLSTLRGADRLIVLDRNTVAEIGTHDELMRKKGIYYGLVAAQSKLHKVH